MKVIKWSKMDSQSGPGYMIQVSPKEALNLIQSLTFQMMNENSNSGRAEMYTEDKHEYFSIAVHDDTVKGIPPGENEVEFIYDQLEWQAKNGRELAHSLNKKGSLAE